MKNKKSEKKYFLDYLKEAQEISELRDKLDLGELEFKQKVINLNNNLSSFLNNSLSLFVEVKSSNIKRDNKMIFNIMDNNTNLILSESENKLQEIIELKAVDMYRLYEFLKIAFDGKVKGIDELIREKHGK